MPAKKIRVTPAGVKAPKDISSVMRPPIVAVLGHVDHGKTSLISKIKEIDLTRKEFGGISQHTKAYTITFGGKKITFIDTPGHTAFSAMRSRGAKVADIALLVVAVDEGVKPQTLESFDHIQKAQTPLIVVINKIDLAEANLDWLKKELSKNKILVEGYGGEIVAVPVSAKTGKGISDLLEMIFLVMEMTGLKGGKNEILEAMIIESRMEAQKGIVGTILVRNGVLRIGEEITVEGAKTKIKAMFGEAGQSLQEIEAGQAAEVIGFNQMPPVGALVEKGSPMGKALNPVIVPKPKKTEGEDDKKLRIILKADTAGTLEAICASFSPSVTVIDKGVGDVSQSDVVSAVANKAMIFGFNIKTPSAVEKIAEVEKIKIRIFQIIYDLLDEAERRLAKILKPGGEEEIIGRAEILAEFNMEGSHIAGCRVVEGELGKQGNYHLQRGDQVLGDCRIKSLKIGKTDVELVKKGEECGLVLQGRIDFKIGDVLVCFKRVEE